MEISEVAKGVRSFRRPVEFSDMQESLFIECDGIAPMTGIPLRLSRAVQLRRSLKLIVFRDHFWISCFHAGVSRLKIKCDRLRAMRDERSKLLLWCDHCSDLFFVKIVILRPNNLGTVFKLLVDQIQIA